jgi:hypothetical protein
MPLGWILAPFFELQKYLQSSLHREMKLHTRKEGKQEEGSHLSTG